jgi:hypothetical protein
MVTQIDRLADFVNTDTAPAPKWLQVAFEAQRAAIVGAIERGEEYKIKGPGGEVVTIRPERVTA